MLGIKAYHSKYNTVMRGVKMISEEEIKNSFQQIFQRLNSLEKSKSNSDFSAFYCKKCGERLKIKYERGNPYIYFMCPNGCDNDSDILTFEELIAILNN